EDLEALRDRWNQWLEGAATTIANIRRGAERDEERIGSSDVDLLIGPLLAAARLLGRRSLVTPPNLASIMFLLESGGKSVLLTGDGHWQDVLHGLENAGRLDAEGRLHVDALKVPHHGSEHNTHPDFARAITAKRYVFCGNGSHENPDLDVISTYANSRFGSAAQRSTNREVGHRFEMIFNTSAALETGSRRQHMARVEKHVRELAADSGGQMKFRFLTASRYRFTV
ncbi:MAG: hypothetical protein KDE27_12180, partial [Planctomycetes bacterium]|nr:hypothetical protein [Planctomycetota bacterium]